MNYCHNMAECLHGIVLNNVPFFPQYIFSGDMNEKYGCTTADACRTVCVCVQISERKKKLKPKK